MTIYYTYCSYETDKGTKSLYYIGFRKCPEGKTPETDNYFGSPMSPKNKEFKDNPNKDKVILGLFDSKGEALAHEIWLHDLHDVAVNPTFANRVKQTSTGFSYEGQKHSAETRQKMSESRTGSRHPFYGKNHSEESKVKISKSISGEKHYLWSKKLPEETKAKISDSMRGSNNPMYGEKRGRENHPMYGKKHSEGTKGKISLSMSGDKNPNYGKKASEETRKRMSESRRGKKNKRVDPTLYDFINMDLGLVELKVTKYDLANKYGLYTCNLTRLVECRQKGHKGWELYREPYPEL